MYGRGIFIEFPNSVVNQSEKSQYRLDFKKQKEFKTNSKLITNFITKQQLTKQ